MTRFYETMDKTKGPTARKQDQTLSFLNKIQPFQAAAGGHSWFTISFLWKRPGAQASAQETKTYST